MRNRQHGFPSLTLLTIWPNIGRMHLRNITTLSDRAQGPENVLWKIKKQNRRYIIKSSMLLGKEIYCTKTFKAFFSPCFKQPAFYIKELGGQSTHTHTHTHKLKKLFEKLYNFYREASYSPFRRQRVLLSDKFLFFSTSR